MKILSRANVTKDNQVIAMKFFDQVFDAALKSTQSGVFYHHNISQLLWGYKDNFLDAIQKYSTDPSLAGLLKSLNITFPKNLTTFIQLQVLSLCISSNNNEDFQFVYLIN